MKSKAAKRPWGKMTAAELAEATREFDHPLPASRYKNATKADRERFERAMRAGGGLNERLHAFGVDQRLLTEAAEYAKKKRLTMSQLLERGLRRELAVQD